MFDSPGPASVTLRAVMGGAVNRSDGEDATKG